MISAPIEYHSSAKVKIERRPKRSDKPAEGERADEHSGEGRADEAGEAVQVEQAFASSA